MKSDEDIERLYGVTKQEFSDMLKYIEDYENSKMEHMRDAGNGGFIKIIGITSKEQQLCLFLDRRNSGKKYKDLAREYGYKSAPGVVHMYRKIEKILEESKKFKLPESEKIRNHKKYSKEDDMATQAEDANAYFRAWRRTTKKPKRPWTKERCTGMADFRKFLKYVNEYEKLNPDVVEADEVHGAVLPVVQVYAMLMEAYEGRKPVEYIRELMAE